MTHTSPVRRVPTLVLALLAVVALAAGLLAVAPTARAADPVGGSTAGRFYPIDATRVLSTRDTNTPLHQGETRTVDLSSAVPAPASAVVINLTAADGTIASQQTVFPAGTPVPYASSLNEQAGEVRANSVTVAVGQGGTNQNKINVYNWYGTVNVVVDVLGYFSTGVGAPNAGTAYQPLAAPVRLFDTRKTIGPLTSTYPRNIGIVTLDYGSVAWNRSISAVTVNITAMNPVGGGYLAAWDGQGPVPTTSSLNFRSGVTTSNLVTVPVHCTDSTCRQLTFSIYQKYSAAVNVIGDIVGAYVTAGTAGTLVYRPVAPTRIADSRFGRPFGMFGTHSVGGVAAGTWGANARAVNMNVTAVRPQYGTYLTVWPNNASQPGISNVYPAMAGVLTANAIQIKMGSSNSGFKLFNNAGLTTIVIDLQGTYVLDPGIGSAAASSAKSAAADPAPASVSGAVS